MNWDCYSTKNMEHNTVIPKVVRIRKRLMMMIEELGFDKKVDEQSNGQQGKVLLRCAASSCFDKHDLCCKSCDIKNCRYKCNHLDEEVCEYQYLR